MLYRILKIPARIALRMYCRSLQINQREILNANGPLLIAANHPNSFLDAIIIAALFKRPVYSLVRGDVYSNNFFTKILNALKMMPVYRLSEGAENLDQNYSTFSRCRDIFQQNGIVLIFSEGRCINEWKLRPLKKGTARLAISSWESGIPLTVLPAAINYQSFKKFGKNIQLNFGNAITFSGGEIAGSDGKNIVTFNAALRNQLEELVVQIASDDQTSIKNNFEVRQSILKKTLLFIPATLGYIFHIIPYALVKHFLGNKFNNDHYDSVMLAGMFMLYPFYLGICTTILAILNIPYWWLCVFILPFTGWSFIQLKKQF